MESWWDLGEGVGYQGHEPTMALVECPYCGHKGRWTSIENKSRSNPSDGKVLNFEMLQCIECSNYSYMIWSKSLHCGPHNSHHDYRVYPPPLHAKQIKAPRHWPEQVGKAWEQARKSLATDSWDAASAMAGRALQAALKEQGAKKERLVDQIKELGSADILPKPMIEWADEIRTLRNIGAHPDNHEVGVGSQDAKDVVKFTDYFLIYTYNLPEEIKEYRGRRNKKTK